jgi:hypothetical protein
MDLSTLQLIDWRGSERLLIPPVSRRRQWSGGFYIVDRHFAGATVVQVGDEFFLFDTDREELQHFGFNPFFTHLPRPVTTVDEAYDALMPDEVHEAVNNGVNVIRQGEFFFVPVPDLDVRRQMLPVKNDVDEFFYEQAMERLKMLGAAMVNCSLQTHGNQVEEFHKRCHDNNGGKLPESDVDADEVLVPYMRRLAESQVGPEISVPPPPEAAKVQHSGTRPVETHLRYIHEELAARLSFKEEDNRSFTVDGPDAHLRIRYDARIGAELGTTRNAHQATGVYQPEEGVAYAVGAVVHTGREHRTVYLDGWHRVYPNTAVANWTVSGDVD